MMQQSPGSYDQLAKRLKTHHIPLGSQSGGSQGDESRTSASSPDKDLGEEQMLNQNGNVAPKSVTPSMHGSLSPQSNSHSPPPSLTTGKIFVNPNVLKVKATLQPNFKELNSYKEALEYLKPLEEFALFRENFRAIGLLSQLEIILQKGGRTTVTNEEI